MTIAVAAVLLGAAVHARGVLLLTFDDRHWEKWEAVQPIFAKHDAHVTFFPYGTLDASALAALKRLQDAGHTIGIHTLHHGNAAPFFVKTGGEAYWTDEVLPQKRMLESAGIRAETLAYPCSDRNEETDRFLLGKGLVRLRSGRGGDLNVAFPAKELATRRMVEGLGIGTHYRTDIDKVCTLVRRLAAEDLALVVYSHDIADNPSKIGMRTEWLERILATAEESGVAIRGFGELDAPKVVAETCYGGVIEVPGAGFSIRPNERLGTADRFRDGGATLSVVPVGADSFEATWSFASKAEVSVHHLSFELNPATYAGGVAIACDRRVKLPKAFAGTVHLITGEGRGFQFVDATGCERLRIDFSDPVRLHAMDSRAWHQDNIVFRFERPAVTNASVVFSCRVTVPGAQVNVMPRPDSVAVANHRWIPAVIAKDVVTGSAIDFSSLVPVSAPIAERDRIVVRNGRLETAGCPGRAVRFYGCNVTEGANFLDAKTAEAFVAKLRRLGYNSLRLHHHDDGLSRNVGAADPLIAACSRQGLYLTTDLFVSRKVAWRDIGEGRDGFVGMDGFKRLVLTHEGAYSNYCAFARKWLTHVNPLTGRRLADEPALALLAFVNEGQLGTEGEAAKADAALEMRFAARVSNFLRKEIGTKALLSDMSAGMENEAFRPVRESAAYDYVDEHYYCDHPTFPETPWRLPARLAGENPLCTWSGVGQQRKLASVRVKGKPFVMTEWDWTGCFAYRSAAGLVVASVAAADGWDGLWRFNFAGSPWEAMHPDECGIGFFSISGNPLVQATERAAFCLFVRGDATSSDQFVHDKAKGTFTVDTPLTAGGFTESGDIRTKSLVVRCQGGPTTVWASALDGCPLVESRRILLTHLTDIQNAGQTHADDSRRILKKWGKVPHLFRAGTAQIALSLGDGDFEVWALGSDGMRLRKVPSSFTPAGRLTFVADVAADSSSATWLYEILRNPERGCN